MGLKLRRVIIIKKFTPSSALNLAVIFTLSATLFSSVLTPATALPPTCAQGGVCAVGDIGPGGGLVFYVESSPFACGPNHANDCKYLEVAPKTWDGTAADPSYYWHLNSYVVDGISRDGSPNMASTQAGLGLKNSNLIAASDTSTGNASVASRAYRGQGKNDWYLPTIAELGVLCRYAHGQSPIFSSTCDYTQTLNTGIPLAYEFSQASYQSSSQSSSTGNAQWHQNFVSASDGNSAQQSTWGYAANAYTTRPIRAFAPVTTLADGDINCGGGGTFTVTNNVVVASTNCSGSVTIPYGVTAIANSGFYLSAITSISIPNTVTSLGDSSLRHTGLTTVSIPGSVETIGYLAFATSILTSATFATSSNLTTIGDYAFQSSAFTSVTIPASVTTMGTGVFQLNNNLNDLVFSGIIPTGSPWDAPANVGISGKVACGSNGYFVISSNTITGNYDCRGSVNIPVGVTGISSSAFDAHPSDGSAGQQNRYGSTMTPNVTSITIPNTVTAIGSFAFRQSALTSLTIPNSVTSIDIYAFAFSTQIASLTFGNGLTSIGNAAFADLSLISTLTIPDGVSTIGGDAFVGTSALTTLNYCGNADLTGTRLPNPATNAGTCTPAPPTSLSATPGDTTASIAFTPGANFGAGITNYEYSLDGGSFIAFSPIDTTTPVSITGLTNGTTYSVRLRAISARGTGAASAPVSVTPNPVTVSVAAIGGVTAPALGATPVTTVTAANGYTGTVSWSGSPTTFASATTYTATISLTADSGYRFTGVTANFFTVSGATSVTNTADSGMITAVFPVTGDEVISVAAIGGVTAPVSGDTPVTSVIAANGYTGTVSWSGSPTTFSPSTTYTATISLTADSGYTFSGVAANFFTISGATSVTHSANSGTITAVFPATALAAPDFTLSVSSETVTRGTAITGYTINSTGGTIASFAISPAITNTPGLSFSTSTGLITGTPTSAAIARVYTITATNATSPSATATFTITVNNPPPPSVTVATTSFTTGAASNLRVTLNNFDQTLSYQVTIKFVNAQTNVEVTNGTLVATQSGTALISGYTSYSATKLGFRGTYAAIANALSSVTWNPASASNGVSIRIGISSAPGTNEFYDANSGHYYRFVSTAKAWALARTNAESTYMYGLRGYLAEINTEAENTFIANETTAKNVWIGASEDSVTATNYRVAYSYNGSAGQRWIWNGAEQNPLPVGSGLIAQGPPAAYSSWWAPGGEPNNDSKPGADCAVTNWGKNGFWNDLPCKSGYSYLIEYGGRPNEVSTAIAATLTETLTAANPIQYTITYNPNSGNSTPTQGSKTTGQKFNLANAITRSPSGGISYQFAGWESSSKTYGAGETFTVGSSNLGFTASWIQLYEVTYISNGGTFAGAETGKDSECPLTICSNGQVITLNSAPDRTGYIFAGWRDQSGSLVTDSNGGSPGVQTTVTSTNYFFTSSWTIITYEVTYVSSGSTAPTQSPLSTKETFTVGSEPTKSGHLFEGWSDGTNTYWQDDVYVIGTSDVTLTALWLAIYSVTYSEGLGIGTPPVDTSIHLQDSTIEIPSDTGLSRAGFNFGGWSDGSTIVQPGIYYLIGTSNVVLTAQWVSSAGATKTTSTPTVAVTVWTITFDKNGADSGNVPDPLRAYEDSKNTVTLPGNIGRTTTLESKRPLVKKGFTFIGWSTTKTGVTPLAAQFTPTASTTLYAIWQAATTAIPTPSPKPSPTSTPNTQVTPEMVKVGTFYMASGSYFLNDATKKSLIALAKKINASGAKSILVYGHADNRGGVNNTVLSQNRAKAVASYLRPLLTSKKISIGWFSSKKPVATGTTSADLALNRRVEIYTQ